MATYGVKLVRSDPLRLGPHPERPVNESWRQWLAREARPLAVDLFSGGGGLSLGLEQAGFRVILAVDDDARAVETHQHNFPGLSLRLDLADPESLDSVIALLSGLDVAVVAGGPPCQPFSRAGRSKIRSLVASGQRSEADGRRELWQAFLRTVEEVRPAAALMENVPDMALGDDLGVVRTMAAHLEALDYEPSFALVDAWRHSVPQHRQRLILVALRDGRPFEWPTDQAPVSVADAISDLPRLGEGTGALELPYAGPRTALQRAARAAMADHSDIVWDHVTRPIRDDDRRAFTMMDARTRYSELPEDLRRYRADIFDDKYKRLSWDERSRTVTAHIAKDGYWYIHPEEARTLTVREAARLQTFPDNYRFAGTRSDAFRQIGNAVPPALARAIGEAILGAIQRRPSPRGIHESRLWQARRQELLHWGERDSLSSPWRYPGEPWAVLVGTLLAARTAAARPDPTEFLARFPQPTAGSASEIEKLAHTASSEGQRRAVRRLAAAATVLAASSEAWTDRAWVRAAGLGPAVEDWVRCVGLGEDRLIVSAATLRVVARLTGTEVDQERKLSDGKVAIARLVGAGGTISWANASLSALGRNICMPVRPRCSACPLQDNCASAMPPSAEEAHGALRRPPAQSAGRRLRKAGSLGAR
jgi:DNA (cytosine-5)-methyltransferase 1